MLIAMAKVIAEAVALVLAMAYLRPKAKYGPILLLRPVRAFGLGHGCDHGQAMNKGSCWRRREGCGLKV